VLVWRITAATAATAAAAAPTAAAVVLRGARECRAGAIAHRDEQGRNMLAVLARLLESGARAVRGDAFATETNGDGIRIRIGAAHFALGGGVVDVHVLDYLALLVIEAA